MKPLPDLQVLQCPISSFVFLGLCKCNLNFFSYHDILMAEINSCCDIINSLDIRLLNYQPSNFFTIRLYLVTISSSASYKPRKIVRWCRLGWSLPLIMILFLHSISQSWSIIPPLYLEATVA